MRPQITNKIIAKWIIKIEDKYNNIKIDKDVIIPKYIHFILIIDNQTGEHMGSPLHEIIKWFKTQTTNGYINLVKQGVLPKFSNKIWQRSYYEHIIRNEKSYNEIWKYIDENLIKWEEDGYYTD